MARGVLAAWTGRGRVLLVTAAPAEMRAVLGARGGPAGGPERQWALVDVGGGFEVVLTGIGKANAAGAVGRVLDPSRHSAVLSVGVAGSLGSDGPRIGSVVAATACVYADEGLATPEGFVDCAAMGFPLGAFAGSAVPVDGALLEAALPLVEGSGPVATVSTCSGTDESAAGVRRRTGALAEGMEGAAVAQVALRLGVPAGEIRAISNTTGDRGRQEWDLGRALGALARVIGGL